VGGDTTRGPLNICITVFGEVAPGRALRRDAARAGDDLWLSGRTGEARLALERLRGTRWALAVPEDEALCRQRLERPTPRVALGQALTALEGRAPAAIDLSDGLAGDLGHILAASGVGAEIDASALPVAPALRPLAETEQLECLLRGGDDYELLFTAPVSARDAVMQAGVTSATPVHRIGRITDSAGLRLNSPNGQTQALDARSYDHFAPVS
jgi:thiamine-monophosphate kinase